ncbi:MAG: hypothetical protein PVG69_00805 [Desulfobacterales bacterium]
MKPEHYEAQRPAPDGESCSLTCTLIVRPYTERDGDRVSGSQKEFR